MYSNSIGTKIGANETLPKFSAQEVLTYLLTYLLEVYVSVDAMSEREQR